MTTTSGFAPPPTKREIEAYTLDMVRVCVRTLNEEMGDVLHSGVDSLLGLPWDVRVKMSWSTQRTRSRGGIDKRGRPVISLAMRQFNSDRRLYEYQSYYYDPEIGSMDTDWQGVAAGTVAHEVAHAAAWTIMRKTKRPWSGYNLQDFGWHNRGWRAIYRLLRQRHVNHLGSPVTRPKVDLLAAIS